MSQADPSGILEAMRKVRGLMIDVAMLLKEADARMLNAGWGLRNNDGLALLGAGYSINTARNWIPYRAFQFYGRDDRETLVPCIAVLLDEEKVGDRLTQPVVSGLVLRFDGANEPPRGPALYAAADWHLYVPNRKDDGTAVRYTPEVIGKTSAAIAVQSFAVPLIEITSREEVRQRIVDPLLQIIG